MTRTEKYKSLREKLKLESLVIEATYIKSKSDELLKHTKQLKKYVQKEYHTDLPRIYAGDIRKIKYETQTAENSINKQWWKDYELMEDIKPK